MSDADEAPVPSPDDIFWVNTVDAGKVFGMADRTIRNKIRDKELVANKVNNAWMVRVTRAQLEKAGMPVPEGETDDSGIGPVMGEGEPRFAGTLANRIRGNADVPAAVDLEPLTAMIERMAQEKAEIAAAAAMWQERARQAEAQLQQTRLALEAGESRVSEDEVARRLEAATAQARAETRAEMLAEQQSRKSWWARMFGGG